MNEKEKEQEKKYLEAVDVSYSYGLAKSVERIKSNPALGFRTAGSRAEFETGEMLRQEMERIGLKDTIRTGCAWMAGSSKRRCCGFRTQMEGTMFSSWGPIRPSFDRGLSEISAGLCGAGRSPGLCRPGRARLSGSGGH